MKITVAACAGVNGVFKGTGTKPLPLLYVNVPCSAVGPEVIVNASTVPSTSFPSNGIATAPPSSVGVSVVAGVAVGGSLTSPTVILIVAISLLPLAPFNTYGIATVPLKFIAGLNINVAASLAVKVVPSTTVTVAPPASV